MQALIWRETSTKGKDRQQRELIGENLQDLMTNYMQNESSVTERNGILVAWIGKLKEEV